jgi:predicted nucleic acid-binding protein
LLFLIDTNVFSDLMEEQPGVTARLKAVATPDIICTCVIVRGEVYYGISRLPMGKRRDALQLRADGLFKSIICEAIHPTAADRYAA